MSAGRRRLPIPTIAATLAIVLIVAVSAYAKPQYSRIRLSTGAVVYVEFGDDEKMKVAESATKLNEAEAVAGKAGRSRSYEWVSFPETKLPFPETKLPRGVTKVSAILTLYTKPFSRVSAQLVIYQKEQEKKPAPILKVGAGIKQEPEPEKEEADRKLSEYGYLVVVEEKPGKSPRTASYIDVPILRTLSLKMVLRSSKMDAYIGLTLVSGTVRVRGVYKDGKSTGVNVAFTNSKGELVYARKGELGDFGFG